MLWFGMLWCGQPWLCRLRLRWQVEPISYRRGRPFLDVIFGVMIPFIYAKPAHGCGCLVTARDTLTAWRAYRLRTRLLRALITVDGHDDRGTDDRHRPADRKRCGRDHRTHTAL